MQFDDVQLLEEIWYDDGRHCESWYGFAIKDELIDESLLNKDQLSAKNVLHTETKPR